MIWFFSFWLRNSPRRYRAPLNIAEVKCLLVFVFFFLYLGLQLLTVTYQMYLWCEMAKIHQKKAQCRHSVRGNCKYGKV